MEQGCNRTHGGCERSGQALAFLVFSNCEEILVIMPRAATNDSRDSTCGGNSKMRLFLRENSCCWRVSSQTFPFLVVLPTSPRHCLYNMY